ncbi:hypothetical protein [Streptomyces sp. NBC_00038]|uniref:hypothetical protein n=1 Tax=Streptomyces sp. NBC_00038 TaxID=2903615 RepID=UPI002250943B|nr:hypothetical protein [Streptomyces sp. NBC_00038]MCX5559952.1 hypothetical protein [Streptomyces sp. NBC_00038]
MGTEAQPFGSWHLRGGRYEQHGLPVEVLSEFARYERLVVDVAKALYMRRHPTRQRAPRQFSQFSLRLSDVREGSVIPVLEAPRGEDSPLFENYDAGVFDEARLIIQEALKSVGDGGTIPSNFPPNALREFSRFGRSLQDGEFIYFDEGHPSEATYSQNIRRTIQELARLDRFEVETLVIGQITGVYADDGTFKIRLAKNGKVIAGRFSSDDIVPDLRQYLDVSALAPTVSVSSVAIQSINDDIIEIQDVLNIEPVLPADWSERLTELHKLEAGWLEGTGEVVVRRVLRRVESLLLELLDSGIERPYIYPTERGGVQLEWSSSAGEVTAEITKTEEIEIYAFSKSRDDELDKSFTAHQLEEAAQFLLGGIQQYAR